MRTLFCFLILLLPLTLSGQNNKFSFILEAGHESRSTSFITFEDNVFGARLFKYSLFYSMLQASWKPVKFFKPEVKVQTWFKPDRINSFNPYFIRYDVDFNIMIKNIEFGYRHYCFHTIDRILYNDGADNFFVRIKIN